MGKIVTLGKAERRVPYDVLTTKVKFCSEAARTDVALRTVLKESEQFLKQLKEAGISLANIEAGKNNVWKNTSGKKEVYAERGISFRTAYDPGFVDCITRMIADAGFEAGLSLDSEITNVQEVKNELFEEAAKNAKESAERVAAAMGLKVVSLERIKTEESDRYRRDVFERGEKELSLSDISEGVRNLSKGITVEDGYSELSAPKTKIEVVVYAEWNIE